MPPSDTAPGPRKAGRPRRGGTDARLSFVANSHFLAELVRAAAFYGMDRQSFLRGALDHDVCRTLEARDGGEPSAPFERRYIETGELLRLHAVAPVPTGTDGEPEARVVREGNTKVPREFRDLVAEAARHRGTTVSNYVRDVAREIIRATEERRAAGHPPQQLSERRVAEANGIYLEPELVRDSLESIRRFTPRGGAGRA